METRIHSCGWPGGGRRADSLGADERLARHPQALTTHFKDVWQQLVERNLAANVDIRFSYGGLRRLALAFFEAGIVHHVETQARLNELRLGEESPGRIAARLDGGNHHTHADYSAE